MKEKDALARIKFVWQEVGKITGEDCSVDYLESLKDFYKDSRIHAVIDKAIQKLNSRNSKDFLLTEGGRFLSKIVDDSFSQDGNWYSEPDPNLRTVNLSANFNPTELAEIEKLTGLKGMVTLEDLKKIRNLPHFGMTESSKELSKIEEIIKKLEQSFFLV